MFFWKRFGNNTDVCDTVTLRFLLQCVYNIALCIHFSIQIIVSVRHHKIKTTDNLRILSTGRIFFNLKWWIQRSIMYRTLYTSIRTQTDKRGICYFWFIIAKSVITVFFYIWPPVGTYYWFVLLSAIWFDLIEGSGRDDLMTAENLMNIYVAKK